MCAEEPCDAAFVGVNLGGWLVLDEDLWPAGLRDRGIHDEWSFIQGLGGPRSQAAIDAMHKHWDEWVTEADLDALRAFGVTHCRIPIGYWLLDDSEKAAEDGFVGGAQRYLFRALAWLKARGMKAVLVLQGAPGGQAPKSGAVGRSVARPGLFEDAHEHQRGREVIRRLAKYIAASDNNLMTSKVIVGMEMLNEPDWRHWDTTLGIKALYEAMVPEIREVLPPSKCALLLSFAGPVSQNEGVDWLASMRTGHAAEAYTAVFYDMHMSHAYGDDNVAGQPWNADVDICKTCCRDPRLLQPLMRSGVPAVVGAYSVETGVIRGEAHIWKEYLQSKMSLWASQPGVFGSFFWNHKVVAARGKPGGPAGDTLTALPRLRRKLREEAWEAPEAPLEDAAERSLVGEIEGRGLPLGEAADRGGTWAPVSLLEVIAGAPDWKPELRRGLCPDRRLAQCPTWPDDATVTRTDSCEWRVEPR